MWNGQCQHPVEGSGNGQYQHLVEGMGKCQHPVEGMGSASTQWREWAVPAPSGGNGSASRNIWIDVTSHNRLQGYYFPMGMYIC